MEQRRTITHPIDGDTSTFLKTCAETNGKSTLCEMELPPNAKGVPPHFHNSYTETFTVLEGELTVKIGKETITLKKGESATVPKKAIHSFTNKSAEPVKATVELLPGSEGFENSIYIMYGLANDGKCGKNGLPKKISHLALSAVMSDTSLPGFMTLIMPIMKMIAKRAQKKGIEKELIDKYCLCMPEIG